MNSSQIITLMMTSMNFAAVKHKDQRRNNPEKTPYINHPIGVAYILTEAGVVDISVIVAAILHDTVEDTDATFEEIERLFGSQVKDIVAQVTDNMQLPLTERRRLQIVNAPNLTFEARLVRLADKLYNLRDAEKYKNKDIEYFKWVNQVVNCIRGTNTIMENQLDEILKKYNFSNITSTLQAV